MTTRTDPPFTSCAIIGLGYIGLPTAVVVARAGIDVIGVDSNPAIIEAIRAGRCPIEEPHLPEALASLVAAGRITASMTPAPADVFLIAVPTPFTGGYKPDLTHVEAATRSIAPHLKPGNLVIVESTIPVGATEQVGRWIERLRPEFKCLAANGATPDIFVAHCPERVLPGHMLRELVENDRVIGGLGPASGERGRDFYAACVTGTCLVTDARTAELCKLTENAFRDVNIAFANELADICEDFGIDVWDLIALANHHPRVNILKPGPGVGGHCIAVDPWFIVSALGEKARLIREARWINSARPRHVARKVFDALAKDPSIRTIGCFGLAYKPDVDDMRESPAVEVVELLARELQIQASPVRLLVAEPHVTTLPHEFADATNVELVDQERALDTDLLLMLVDHKQFHSVPASRRAGRCVIDTRGVWRA